MQTAMNPTVIRSVLLAFTLLTPLSSFAELHEDPNDHRVDARSFDAGSADPTFGAARRPLHPALRVLRELGGGTLVGAGAGAGAVGFAVGFGVGFGLLAGQTSASGIAAAIPILFGAVGGGVLFPFGWIAGVRWGGDAYGSLAGATLGLLGGAVLGLLVWSVPEVGHGLAVALPLVGTVVGYELSRQFGPFAHGRLAVTPFAAKSGGGVSLAMSF